MTEWTHIKNKTRLVALVFSYFRGKQDTMNQADIDIESGITILKSQDGIFLQEVLRNREHVSERNILLNEGIIEPFLSNNKLEYKKTDYYYAITKEGGWLKYQSKIKREEQVIESSIITNNTIRRTTYVQMVFIGLSAIASCFAWREANQANITANFSLEEQKRINILQEEAWRDSVQYYIRIDSRSPHNKNEQKDSETTRQYGDTRVPIH